MQEAYDRLSTPEERDKVDNPDKYEEEYDDFDYGGHDIFFGGGMVLK